MLRLGRSIWMLPALLTMLPGAGCRTAGPFPPADLSASGWQVLQGQAVWKTSPNSQEITGDLILATNANGNCFIQFTKVPFPLVTAQTSGDRWQIEFGGAGKSWRGWGAPPGQLVWFQLPPALLMAKPGENWRFARRETNLWRLNNLQTGETLEGEFFP